MIAIILLIALKNVAEAYNDFWQWKEVTSYIQAYKAKTGLQRKQFIAEAKKYNSQWHLASALDYTIVIAIFYFVFLQQEHRILTISLMIFTRGVIFNSGLNLLRGRKLWYRGNCGFDGKIKKWAMLVFITLCVLYVVNIIAIL